MLKYCPNLESSDPMNLPLWMVVGTLPFKTNTNHPQDKLAYDFLQLLPLQSAKGKKMV